MVVHLHVALRWTGNQSRVYHCLSPKESWDRLQQISVTLNRTKRVWIMDGCSEGAAGESTDVHNIIPDICQTDQEAWELSKYDHMWRDAATLSSNYFFFFLFI